MKDRARYSIKEARELLGSISRDSIYRILCSGSLKSVVIGCRRFISSERLRAKGALAGAHRLPAALQFVACRCRGRRSPQNGARRPVPATSLIDQIRHFHR